MKKRLIIIGIFLVLFVLVLPKNKDVVEINALNTSFNNKTGILLEKDHITNKKINGIKSTVSNKTIYLTFDDGPSFLTKQILDILDEKQVPATFFLVGTHISEYKEDVKREYLSGHTVAIHSDTHNYEYIYTSIDNYVSDLNQIRYKIHSITNTYPRIIRLPGGSSNTVSKKYKEGVVTEITSYLNAHDYYYFDWNVDSLDASGKVSRDVIYNSVTSHLKDGNNIVLMHDAASKQTTVDALSDIIDYGKQNGYTFAKITKDTEMYHHRVRN